MDPSGAQFYFAFCLSEMTVISWDNDREMAKRMIILSETRKLLSNVPQRCSPLPSPQHSFQWSVFEFAPLVVKYTETNCVICLIWQDNYFPVHPIPNSRKSQEIGRLCWCNLQALSYLLACYLQWHHWYSTLMLCTPWLPCFQCERCPEKTEPDRTYQKAFAAWGIANGSSHLCVGVSFAFSPDRLRVFYVGTLGLSWIVWNHALHFVECTRDSESPRPIS